VAGLNHLRLTRHHQSKIMTLKGREMVWREEKKEEEEYGGWAAVV
jgi:hypothetical protein